MDEDFEQANLNVKIFAASFTLGGLAILVVGFVLAVHRQRQSFWVSYPISTIKIVVKTELGVPVGVVP